MKNKIKNFFIFLLMANLLLISFVQASTVNNSVIYRVSVGSFINKTYAEKQLSAAKAKGYKDVYISQFNEYYRVNIGAFTVKKSAESLLKQAKDKGFTNAFLYAVQNETLLIYSMDSNYKATIEYKINVSQDASVLDKLNAIAKHLMTVKYKGSTMEVKSINIVNNKKIAYINLIDNKNSSKTWHSLAQGSTGGIILSHTLIESFLQKDYKGPWIDGVRFLYNGKEIAEYDETFQHASSLSKVSYR